MSWYLSILGYLFKANLNSPNEKQINILLSKDKNSEHHFHSLNQITRLTLDVSVLILSIKPRDDVTEIKPIVNGNEIKWNQKK